MENGGSEYFASKAGQNATASEFHCHTDAVASSLSSPASTRWLNNGEAGELNMSITIHFAMSFPGASAGDLSSLLTAGGEHVPGLLKL